MTKVKSGILGLDELMDGGLNEHSVTVLVGSVGTGKTIMSLEFIREGLENGVEAIYITMEETKSQIIEEAKNTGWSDIENYIKKGSLVFLESSGTELADFITNELPQFVNDWKNSKSRIVIDPLTPLIWAYERKYVQRELISNLFKQTKCIGTVFCTIESLGISNDTIGVETIIPMYLADTVIHIYFGGQKPPSNRMMHIRKNRLSWHSEGQHPYHFVHSSGFVIDIKSNDIKSRKYSNSEIA